jgi:hypothetical protein
MIKTEKYYRYTIYYDIFTTKTTYNAVHTKIELPDESTIIYNSNDKNIRIAKRKEHAFINKLSKAKTQKEWEKFIK